MMAAPDTTRSETPPHHPNYQIHLPASYIEKLVELSLPGAHLVSVTQLASGRSYNNRIYYVDVSGSSAHPGDISDTQEQQLVLKVNGRFFGADKVQNEVACLQLLETHSPGVPVPRVLAWSEDGENMTSLFGGCAKFQGLTSSTGKTTESGWILMTRVPGEAISVVQPSSDQMYELLAELARYVANWRRLIPSQEYVGNLRFCEIEYEHSRPDIMFGSSDPKRSNVVIRGLLGEDLKRYDSIANLGDYYRIRIAKKMGELEGKPVYEPNRAVVLPLLKDFVTEKLPHLKLLSQDIETSEATSTFVFTHYDLSPRNILVSGQPPRITGIVDFEFAGFFSPLEEFLNDHVNNNGDWPDEIYQSYLDKLEQNGIATPARGFDKEQWEQALCLEELLQHIAPWWLPGKYEGIALEAELRKSEVIVRETLQKFNTDN
jgi:Ser/Thr protein kinase RdoA (MazF antagonist)